MKIKKLLILLLSVILLTGCDTYQVKEDSQGNAVLSKETKINEIINDPMFSEFGRLLFPTDLKIYPEDTLNDLELIMKYNTNVDVDNTVEVFNYMKDQINTGNKIFYKLYTPEEIEGDNTLNNVGLFFFKGDDNAKFAINVPGSNYEYISAIQDGFPISLNLAKDGYNAFTLVYRPDKDKAQEDLSRAIKYIFEHKEVFKVDTNGYSLWGADVGGNIVNTLTINNTGESYPNPAIVVLQYAPINEVTGKERPTYSVVGSTDQLYKLVEQRNVALKNAGVKSENNTYVGLDHGFGLGKNTPAEGWINNAIRFWIESI